MFVLVICMVLLTAGVGAVVGLVAAGEVVIVVDDE